MTPPSKAVVLAAGFSTRMQPLSTRMPKTLMPVWGIPVLERILALLRRWKVRDVLVNLHHGAPRVFQHLQTVPRPDGLRLSFSYESQIRGTGGALRYADWFLPDSPFWVVNGDIAADLSPSLLLRTFRKLDPLAVLWLVPDAGPRTVETRNGRIATFRSRHPGSPGTSTFSGLHLVSPRIREYLSPAPFSSLVETYEAAQRQGAEIAGVVVPRSFWADIGTPSSYLEAHRAMRNRERRGRTGRPFAGPSGSPSVLRRGPALAPADAFVSAGRDVRIARTAVVADSVLWDRCCLGPRARVRGAIIGEDARVNTTVDYMALPLDQCRHLPLFSVAGEFGWNPAKTTVFPLPPRGSARAFFRLQSPSGTVMALLYSALRPENLRYAPNAAFLARNGVPVPRVLLHDASRGLVVVEDLGNLSLRAALQGASPARVRLLYRRVLDILPVLHDRAGRRARAERLSLEPPFAADVYRYEHDLFLRHFFRGRRNGRPARAAALRRELLSVAALLRNEPPVLIHRDLQSDNILFRRGRPVLIDFQGMRFGPAAYDLASLLCDPYVSLPEPLRQMLLADYCRRVRAAPANFGMVFRWAAVQRLVQALGAYARLSAAPETAHFSRHIAPALRLLRGALSQVDSLPVLQQVVEEALTEEV